MAKEIFYDTRSISAATEQQFFHESRAKHADKEIGTNMPKDSEFGKAITIKKIVCVLEPQLKGSATAKDTALLGDLLKVLSEGILQVQAGNGTIYYLPLSYCVAKNLVDGVVQYTLGAAADGSYGLFSAQSVNGGYGLEVNIPVALADTLKFYLKTKSSVTLANIRMVLEVETA